MRGPTRLGLALLALLALWVTVYWFTQAPAPRDAVLVSFGEAPGDIEAFEPNPVEPVKPEPGPAGEQSPSAARRENDTASESASDTASAPPPAPPFAPPVSNEPAAVEPRSQPAVIPPTFREHTVKFGDTASSLSRQYFKTDAHAVAIMMSNPNVDFQHLKVGQVIRIPVDPANIQGVPNPNFTPPAPEAPRSYTVVEGDTLGAISSRFYGTSALWTLIRDANSDKVNEEGTNIRPGMVLTIPAKPRDEG